MSYEQDPTARVLVVDDQATNVRLLTEILRRVGFGHVEGITDSSLTMQRIRAFDPDVVLLDLHMPDPDGFDLLRQINALDGDTYVPIVVMTADVTEGARERALAGGAADFLTKPFDATETLLRVRNLIRTRRLHQALRRNNVDLAAELERHTEADHDRSERIHRVTAVVEDTDRNLTMAFQPIVRLGSGHPDGYEALARFSASPQRTPDVWFADAAEAGLGLELELAAVRQALDHAALLPASTFLSVNVSPDTLVAADFIELMTGDHGRSLVIELTEHVHIDDYGPVTDTMQILRRSGVRLAVDDTGSGFASLTHILSLQPELIKLDRELVTDIDHDPARAALARALVSFCADVGAELIAEGIETAAELEALDRLGVHFGQGYHLGRPGPLCDHRSAGSLVASTTGAHDHAS